MEKRKILNCRTCFYLKDCEKEYGKLDTNVENCSAIIGSHFCRASWDDFKCGCREKNLNLIRKALQYDFAKENPKIQGILPENLDYHILADSFIIENGEQIFYHIGKEIGRDKLDGKKR